MNNFAYWDKHDGDGRGKYKQFLNETENAIEDFLIVTIGVYYYYIK